jgi:serine/threonine protein kinase
MGSVFEWPSSKNVICPDHIVLHKNIGNGSSGTTYYGTYLPLQTEVAVKVVNKAALNERQLKRVHREIKFLYKLKHQNICKLYGEVETNSHICLIMELCKGGDLCDILNKNGPMSESKARSLFVQLLSAVNYLHKKGILHRDIKLDNIFTNKTNDKITLGDFGLAAKWKQGTPTKDYVGSINYAAPEVIQHKPFVGPEADIWSCGVVLLALVTASLPFEASNDNELMRNVVRGNYRIPSSADLSPSLLDLIRRMLTIDPAKRITMDQIMVHPWIVGDEDKKLQLLKLHDMKPIKFAQNKCKLSNEEVQIPSRRLSAEV